MAPAPAGRGDAASARPMEYRLWEVHWSGSTDTIRGVSQHIILPLALESFYSIICGVAVAELHGKLSASSCLHPPRIGIVLLLTPEVYRDKLIIDAAGELYGRYTLRYYCIASCHYARLLHH